MEQSTFFLLCLAVWTSLIVARVCGQDGPRAVPYNTPETCDPTEFFQSGNLSCVRCGDEQVPAQDGLSCVCEAGYIRPAGVSGNSFQCTACSSQQVVSQDGLFCLECDTEPCNQCSDTEVYVDTLPSSQNEVGSRSCVQCPEGTWADSSGFRCVECGISNCFNCTASTTSGGVCFEAGLSLPPPPSDVFPYYSEHYSAAVELCKEGNQTSCQLLGNLCVLQTYNLGDPACEMASTLAGDILPPLYYPKSGADELLQSTEIETKFVVKDSAEGSSVLPLVVVTFGLNGSLVGIEDVSEQILSCRDRYSHTSAAWMVGVAYQIECTVPVSLLASSDTVFYDLYLRDEGDSLYPIPVLVDDYRDQDGGTANRDSDPEDWQFVRRFYLTETVTSSPRYAKEMELRVMLDSDGKIFPPYLYVNYHSWNPESGRDLKAEFRVKYRQNTTGFDIGISAYLTEDKSVVGKQWGLGMWLGNGVTLSILCITVLVYTGFKANGFLRRSGGLCCELHTFIYFAVEVCASLSTAIFIVLAIACTFWLTLFKAQSTFFVTLPVGTQELVFQIPLGFALLFRILYTVYLIWHQCTVDVFLIDWERPRGVLLTTNQNTDASAPPTTVTSPVSIWRTYFVANEWNEIQSVRKINSTLLLFLVILFLKVAGFEHLAERDPSSEVTESEDRYSSPHSTILRFSLTSLHFIIIAVILRLFVYLIYERFFEHKIRQFVDLCSVSNVSVFIMSRKLYGYYIHGRSVHGHADTNMREMNHNLHKEQEDMCGRRGLMADSDDQIFEMALTRHFRTHYDRIISPIQAERAEGQLRANLTQRGQNTVPQGLSEAGLKAYGEMNQFLSAFLERSLRDVDYVVKEKLFLERLLEIEFYDAVDRSLFYQDPGYSFTNVLFYGNEWSLLQLDILVFAVVDLIAQDYALAAIITYLISWVLGFIRDSFGRRNLAKKTLVDDRFLI